jgi:hypothetical protein
MEKNEKMIAGATIALVLYVAILSAIGPMVSAALTKNQISNIGSIKAVGVGVYWDQACVNSTSQINWGLLEPGSNVSKTIYIRNEGNTAATLSMTISNWNPLDASNYMTLTWNYNGQNLNVGAVIQVKLTLSVSSNISGITNFSFLITIMANG